MFFRSIVSRHFLRCTSHVRSGSLADNPSQPKLQLYPLLLQKADIGGAPRQHPGWLFVSPRPRWRIGRKRPMRGAYRAASLHGHPEADRAPSVGRALTKQAACPLSPNSGQTRASFDRPLKAKSALIRCRKLQRYSIALLVRAKRVGGTVMPSALAVLRLMARSNRVGSGTGNSAGLAPLRIRPAGSANVDAVGAAGLPDQSNKNTQVISVRSKCRL